MKEALRQQHDAAKIETEVRCSHMIAVSSLLRESVTT